MELKESAVPSTRGCFENNRAAKLVGGWRSRFSSGRGDRGGSMLWAFTVR